MKIEGGNTTVIFDDTKQKRNKKVKWNSFISSYMIKRMT